MRNWKTTSLGIITIAIALAEAVKALLDNDPNTNVNFPVLIATITSGWGLIHASDAKPTPAPSASPTATALLALALAGLALSLFAPRIARADEPVGTACFSETKVGKLCFQPDVAAALVQMDMKTGKLTTTIDPMLGYGMKLWADKPYAIGISGHLGIRPGASDADQRMMFTGGLSFFNYVQLQAGRVFRGDGHWLLFIGLGSDLVPRTTGS